jgi:hypothetical protein|tara:strand:- start:1437 stop:1550 length:114 start_codon:yes stop_codon:yes gene_type:complete
MEMMLVVVPLVGLIFAVMGLGLVLAGGSDTAGKKKKK